MKAGQVFGTQHSWKVNNYFSNTNKGVLVIKNLGFVEEQGEVLSLTTCCSDWLSHVAHLFL